MADSERSRFDASKFFIERTQIPAYGGESPLPPTENKVIYLNEGKYQPPEETQEILEELVSSGQMYEAVTNYEGVDTMTAENNVRKLHGIGKKPFVGFSSGGGSHELIERLALQWHQPPKTTRIWGITPHFPGLNQSIDMLHRADAEPAGLIYGAIHIPFEKDLNEALDIAMMRRFENSNLDNVIGYLCDPGTPKGDRATLSKKRDWVRFCQRNGDIAFVDEVFGAKDSIAPLTEQYDNLIVLRSLSKMVGLPGAGIGYVIASPEIGKYLKQFQRQFHTRGLQALIANHFTEPEMLNRHFDRITKKIREDKTKLVEGLTEAGIKVLPTDMETPIFAVDGEYEGYYGILRSQGIETARGGGFFSATTDYERFTNRFVRSSLPEDSEDIPVVIERMVEAKEIARSLSG